GSGFILRDAADAAPQAEVWHCIRCKTLMVRRRAAPSRTMQARTFQPVSGQEPLARHVVDFEPDAVGILEQHRVVAGRPLILARGADDFGADRGEESMQ